MATATAHAAPFAQELQALKADLQRTLARLGTVPVDVRASPPSPWSQQSATTTTTATTPTTVRSDATSGRSHSSPTHNDMAARILHELVVTARRRRQVEMHMARELERELRTREDETELTWNPPARAARDANYAVEKKEENTIQTEIEALRLRRKQILLEIDNESKSADAASVSSTPQATNTPSREDPLTHIADVSNLSASIRRQSDHEYSIEGVVKLGSLLARQTRQETASQTSPPRHHPPQAPHCATLHPPSLYRNYRHPPHDMMQDVFAIQLKFAETMLQLEKSIQTRDQLLVAGSIDRSRRRSTSSRHSAPVRRRARLPSTIHEDRERDSADSSDDDPLSLPLLSDEASMSEDTMRMWRRYRQLDRQRALSPGTTRSSPSTGESVATTTTSTSPNSQPSPQAQATENDAVTSPIASTMPSPTNEEHLVTPSTTDSGNKQVRFYETNAPDAYSTPLIARNISFDQDSIDSTDDDQPLTRRRQAMVMAMTRRPAPDAPRQQRTTVVSSDDEALSFLDGSSVCSADLQDESFLTAFYAMRRELLGDRLRRPSTPPQSTPPQSIDPGRLDVNSKTAAADLATLKQQKRSLTLDIQASTATLVLAQDATQRAEATATLERLRHQLQTIEALETNSVQA